MNTVHKKRFVTDLNTILNEVISDQVDEDAHQNIHIKMDTLPSVMAVPDQMEQLFTNLISNAIKYRKPDITLEIRIQSEEDGNFWKIILEDNGIGFEPQYKDKIFELFQRLHSRFEYEGTGIGLSICKKIVQNHYGWIKAIGAPGMGARFEIFLPVSLSE
jgi:hypothetical protein